MSRRHLTLAVAALASLVITACGSNPTAPQSSPRASSVTRNADALDTSSDSTNRSGWTNSSG